MKSSFPYPEVRAWYCRETLMEFYHYFPGPVEPLPKHSHEEYQLGLSFDAPGEYYYRGARHSIGVGCLSILHSGEIHAPRECTFLSADATYRMLYVSPAHLQAAGAQVSERSTSFPFFAEPVIQDSDITQLFLHFHHAVERAASRLEQESRMLLALTELILRYSTNYPSEPPVWRQAHSAVQKARDYLADNRAESVSLEDLAQFVGLSPFHLCRAFRNQIGVPPHVFQNQMRVDRAKLLLSQGWPLFRVVYETGFYDLSHLTKYFKRFVGTTPGEYAARVRNSKNVQNIGS